MAIFDKSLTVNETKQNEMALTKLKAFADNKFNMS